MFRSMIDVCAQNQMIFRYVLADSWFSSKENMEHIRELNKHFIFAVKSNRTVALSREEKLRGEFKSVSELNLKEGEATLVFMKGLDFGVLLVKQVFTNKD